ncbi:MAG: PIG-L family deacetylase [bacterium]
MPQYKLDLLAVGSHPDDVEVGAGGVLAGLTRSSKKCGIVVLTQGEMGTGGTPEIRAHEVEKAAGILGAVVVKTFDWGDTRLDDDYDKRQQLAAVIRETQPAIILAPCPLVGHGRRQSHPDHVAAGVIAINAASLASLKKADLPGQPHQARRIFHYFLPPGLSPTFVVDITPHFKQWLKALSAHKSQFLNPEKTRDYLETITAMARSFGLQAGCRYGQGFYAVEPIRVHDIMSLVAERGD